jgi:beta-lactamase regulating signal transducer with metallopeptidase domain
MSALVNGMILSFLLSLAIGIMFRLSRRMWNASTRYLAWLGMLLMTVGFPFLLRIENSARPAYQIRIPAGRWAGWLLLSWILVSGVMLLRLAYSSWVLHRRKAAAVPLAGGHDRISRWLAKCSTSRRARLAISNDISAPIAAGPIQPSILIPAHLLQALDHDQIEQIGLHEAAHLARRDDYSLLLQRVCEALFVFHPLVHWIAKRMDLEREIACDDIVVEITGHPRSYAECLTRIAELANGDAALPLAAPATQPQSVIETRVDRLLDRKRINSTGLMTVHLAALLAVASFTFWIGSTQPRLLTFVEAIEAASEPAATIPIPEVVSDERSGGSKRPLPARSTAGDSARTSNSPAENVASTDSPTAAAKPDAAASSAAPEYVAQPSSLGVERMLDIAAGRINQSYPSVAITSCRSRDGTPADGWCVLVRHTLSGLIATAYQSFNQNGIQIPRTLIDEVVVGVPTWAGRNRFFDMEARADDDTSFTEDRLERMLQSLLADRFKLAFHIERREVSGYAVTVDPNGPQPKRATAANQGMSVASLIRSLATALERPVVDRTGLTGRYDLALGSPAGTGWPDSDLLEAVRAQFGIRVEPQIVTIDVIVIDWAEQPVGRQP